jgi:CubicO group peptidase (beta-lactamase class C family)
MDILDSNFSASGPGAVLAIATDGQEPVVACSGVACLKQAAPIQRDTLFELASATKMFTAAAIMKLGEQGQPNIDTAISDYVPQCVQQPGVRAISIRDLRATHNWCWNKHAPRQDALSETRPAAGS